MLYWSRKVSTEPRQDQKQIILAARGSGRWRPTTEGKEKARYGRPLLHLSQTS